MYTFEETGKYFKIAIAGHEWLCMDELSQFGLIIKVLLFLVLSLNVLIVKFRDVKDPKQLDELVEEIWADHFVGQLVF